MTSSWSEPDSSIRGIPAAIFLVSKEAAFLAAGATERSMAAAAHWPALKDAAHACILWGHAVHTCVRPGLLALSWHARPPATGRAALCQSLSLFLWWVASAQISCNTLLGGAWHLMIGLCITSYMCTRLAVC